jgi:hypothetical protein
VDSHGIDKLKEKKLDVHAAEINILRIKYGEKESKMIWIRKPSAEDPISGKSGQQHA